MYTHLYIYIYIYIYIGARARTTSTWYIPTIDNARVSFKRAPGQIALLIWAWLPCRCTGARARTNICTSVCFVYIPQLFGKGSVRSTCSSTIGPCDRCYKYVCDSMETHTETSMSHCPKCGDDVCSKLFLS